MREEWCDLFEEEQFWSSVLDVPRVDCVVRTPLAFDED